MADMFTKADERPHHPQAAATTPGWEESWHLDFASADGRTAGYARLTLRPAESTAWWWSVVVGADLPLILVRDHDVPPPKPGTFEIRGSGLWAELVCETPFEHWGLGLEAFAVGLDDPTDAYSAERGDPLPLGFDLEWETTDEPAELPQVTGYTQPCTVHGDVLVGHERFVVAGTGGLAHRWGPHDWWSGDVPESTVPLDGKGLVTASDTLVPVYQAPIQVPSADGRRVSRLARALCRSEPGGDYIWVERLQPASNASG